MNFKRIAMLIAFLATPVAVAWADTTVTSHVVIPQASTALEANHVVSAIPAVLYGASVTTGATAGFFMIINEAANGPGGGAAVTPVWSAQVAANSTVTVPMDPNTKWNFSNGIVLVFSTTGPLTETDASATAFFTWRFEQ